MDDKINQPSGINDSDITALATVLKKASWTHFEDLAKVILQAGYRLPIESDKVEDYVLSEVATAIVESKDGFYLKERAMVHVKAIVNHVFTAPDRETYKAGQLAERERFAKWLAECPTVVVIATPNLIPESFSVEVKK